MKQKEQLYGKIITRRPNGTRRVQTINKLPSKTDQSFKNDCDVNSIMARFKKTGQLPTKEQQGVYADLSNVSDLLTSLKEVEQAKAAFNTLPAFLRERFKNQPVEFINYLNDPKNDDEAVKFGLKVRKNPGPNAKPSAGTKRSAVESKTNPTSKNKQQSKLNDDDSNDDD